MPSANPTGDRSASPSSVPSIELLARHLPNKRDSLSHARARA
jgi:hypothetical protein